MSKNESMISGERMGFLAKYDYKPQASENKHISVQCSACGYTSQIADGLTEAFCTHCGAKIIINRNEYIIVDHARIIQAQAQREVRMRELDLEEQRLQDERSDPHFRIVKTVGSYLIRSKELKHEKDIRIEQFKAQMAAEKELAEVERKRLEAEHKIELERIKAESDKQDSRFIIILFIVMALIAFILIIIPIIAET